jgi:L-seryl-tRNA(Ser) seleniumtransferase
MNSKQQAFRALPSIDQLLQATELAVVLEKVGHDELKRAAKEVLDGMRQQISSAGGANTEALEGQGYFADVCRQVKDSLGQLDSSTLVSVFNLTGTVIHTNLGRAKLPMEAVNAISKVASGASNLEFDLATGKRGDRDSHLEQMLCDITGAEAATVVNNCAAAVVLVLNTLALQKEVLISRGELVEIGGAFRIPDVMRSANALLKEVGTTNRTHLRDFAEALGPGTGAVMKVHTSNYEIKGFTHSVPEAELSALCAEAGVPYISDLGSGTLIELSQFGLPHEPTVQETLKLGADLVTFSGDKLLGGPQAGMIVGKKPLIERIKRNPLKRAFRVDKMTLAGLVEVIRLYKDPRRLQARLPILRDLTRPAAEVEQQASRLLPHVQQALPASATVRVEHCRSQIGSGALPLDLLDSRALVIEPKSDMSGKDAFITGLSKSFRCLPVPVIGRIHDGALIFDLRCLQPDEESEFINQLAKLAI